MKSRLPERSTLALWPVVERYGVHLKERQLKEKSIKGALAALLRFCVFMAELGRAKLVEITKLDLEAYQAHLLELEPATQWNYLSNLRQFFRWIEKTEQIFENPAARMIIAHRPRKLITPPTEPQVRRLLKAPNVATPSGLRDRAWLEVAYGTGARRAEMTRLLVHDVDLQRRLIRLYGKGDKERIVPLGEQAVYWLKEYLRQARPRLLKKNQSQALWLSSHGGNPLGYEAVQQRLRTYIKQTGLPAVLITAHNLRRACTSHMLTNGASPLMLKELLGHVRIATLTHYARQTLAEVRQTHSQSNPGK